MEKFRITLLILLFSNRLFASDTSPTSSDEKRLIEEVIVDIATDPGAGFGGDR